MSYLLFMDESGHDHRIMPYEVRGGIALHSKKLWPFIRDMRHLERSAFGDLLSGYGKEIKGSHLLDKDRFSWAVQEDPLGDPARRKHALAFLNKGAQKKTPKRIEFTAYGQACLIMARGIFELLRKHDAVLFASAIPKGIKKPGGFEAEEFLRKDHVFLLERYFYFLEDKKEPGLLILDESEKTLDRQFVRRLQQYYTRTEPGNFRATWVVPAPFVVSSDMAYPIQAADVCIYCTNWGFRLPRGMCAGTREEIQREFSESLFDLQFKGEGFKDGAMFKTYGIFYVPDPYTGR